VDLENLTVDLITASFDVLSNAMYRGESEQTVFVLRSFLINKIPTLLTNLSGSMFPPLTPDFCIRQAMNRVDPNAFPSFSQGFEMMNDGGNMLSDVRQDFLLACALHHLIQEEAIESILGEAPMAGLPAGGRYVKEDLLTQCSSNTERIEEIIGELESVNGNAGAIVAAITDIIRNACNTKETMSLKTTCNSLSRRPQSLDIIMQFTSPSSILYPLCVLLDTWRYEEDQGESNSSARSLRTDLCRGISTSL
jgi:mediator of RNA polymerase II transcription subunit 5